MINRCYSKRFHLLRPTYKDCTVCDEWLIFSNFKTWMVLQDWKGKVLDKDILEQGNKVYSPSTCIFVTTRINNLLGTHTTSRGEYPQGVYKDKLNNKYKAQCSVDGKYVHIGRYGTVEEAYSAYKKFKYNVIADVASTQEEPLKSALLNYKIT